MPEIIDILKQDSEHLPDWLKTGSASFHRSDFFGSRTVYYPGSGCDGQPVRLCARSHAAHAFVYVDYGKSREAILQELRDPVRGFRGYFIERTENVSEASLRPGGWVQHINAADRQGISYLFATAEPFALFVVLRRKDGVGEDHGPERLAMLFVGGDGYATFDALYCQDDDTAEPYLAVIQDHGFGGDYDRFGRGGILERLARECDRLPKWLLVGKDTEPWAEPWTSPWRDPRGYRDAGADSDPGGEHGTTRRLHELFTDIG